MHEPKRDPARRPLLSLVVDLREQPPDVACALEQLADLLALLGVAVAVGRGVQREA